MVLSFSFNGVKDWRFFYSLCKELQVLHYQSTEHSSYNPQLLLFITSINHLCSSAYILINVAIWSKQDNPAGVIGQINIISQGFNKAYTRKDLPQCTCLVSWVMMTT